MNELLDRVIETAGTSATSTWTCYGRHARINCERPRSLKPRPPFLHNLANTNGAGDSRPGTNASCHQIWQSRAGLKSHTATLSDHFPNRSRLLCLGCVQASQTNAAWTSSDGSRLILRPIDASDIQLMSAFVEKLSTQVTISRADSSISRTRYGTRAARTSAAVTMPCFAPKCPMT